MRRFILIDPCLGDLGSHPYHYCRAVLDAADRGGFVCEAVVPRGLRVGAGAWPERIGLHPILDVPGYSKYTAFGELDTLGADGRPRFRIVPPWAAGHADRRRRAHVEAVARALEPVVARAAPGDVVLLATASELDVVGLARAIRGAGGAPGVGWHALFHFPLYRGLWPDFPRQEPRVDRVRRLLAEALATAAPVPIHFHVTTEELAAQYARLGEAPVGVLPYPVRAVDRRPSLDAGRPLRVAALGDARPEKGSQHLAAVVERVASDPVLAGRVGFAIQTNRGFSLRRPTPGDLAVKHALERLASLERSGSGSNPGVDLLPGPLVGEAYESQVAAADALLLAYDPERYRTRCSSVLLETLASGAVPIVIGGGSMARMLAGPVRRHVESLLERSRRLRTTRHGPARAVHSHAWEMPIDAPPGTTAVVVSLRWQATGPAAILAVPAAVELVVDGTVTAAALVAADETGAAVAAVLPLDPASIRRGPPRLRVGPVEPRHALECAEVSVAAIDSGDRPPVGAVGIVVPPGADLVDGILHSLRELVLHAGHYAATAREHATEARRRFCGERVVEALLATDVGREGPAVEARRA
jgi:hypothetical protein